MRVVHINNSRESFTVSASGAIATHIWEVCRAGMREGARPVVISRDAPEPPFPDVACIWVSEFRKPSAGLSKFALRVRKKVGGWRCVSQPSYAAAVINKIREHELRAAMLILHNDPELAAVLARHFPESKILLHFHNPIPCASRFLRNISLSEVRFSAVSGYVAAEVENHYGKECSAVAINGVDSNFFKPAETSSHSVPEICFLGRTGIEKGADLLLRACLKLAREGFRFGVRLIGSNHWGKWERDPYQDMLFDLCDQLQISGVRVIKTGHVPRSGIPGHLRACTIQVLPSRWQEPCALSLIEGMACGLAIVASKTGGTPEVLRESGLFFEADNVEDLASKLRALLRDPRLVINLGAKARMRALELNWHGTWMALTGVWRQNETEPAESVSIGAR